MELGFTSADMLWLMVATGPVPVCRPENNLSGLCMINGGRMTCTSF